MKPTKFVSTLSFLIFLLQMTANLQAVETKPLRLAVDGLSHDHVRQLLRNPKTDDVVVVGIFEKNDTLAKRLLNQYQLSHDLWFRDRMEMLRSVHPEAVAAYNPVGEHLQTVRACAQLGIPVMVEKPLAATLDQAREIELLIKESGIPFMVNYETSWYPSLHKVQSSIENGETGRIRKILVNDGHSGPAEIGVSKEFLTWLTDPVSNGGGAMTDFGCYGINLITWLTGGKIPKFVVAINATNKPQRYPRVEDESTIVLQYEGFQGIIQASWNWPFSRKDLELYGEKGYIKAINPDKIEYRFSRKENEKSQIIKTVSIEYKSPFSYLNKLVKETIDPQPYDPSSLENNMIVMRILDAARKSNLEGRRIEMNSNRADSLQIVLDRGEDLILKPGTTYEIRNTLTLRKEGQRIMTGNVYQIKDFARIKLAPGKTGMAIRADGIKDILIEKIIIDGNRQEITTTNGEVPQEPLVSLGKDGGDDQTIRQCLIINSRCAGGWGAIHVHENATNATITDNIIFSSGVDIRGNGRSPLEHPFGWGDGISVAAKNSRVINNLVIDVTDEGIMLQGAPGTLVADNVITAVSREMLAGIALIDPFKPYTLDAQKKRYDYKGIIVRDNIIDALGSRIHIGLPMGGLCWSTYFDNTTLVGAHIEGNIIQGNAAGYGYTMNGVDGFVVQNNLSRATYSGIADGLPGDPPDPPGAFLFDPDHVGNSQLQEEFKPMQKHLVHLLRSFGKPVNKMGYRLAPYGNDEATSIVKWAYIEMLDRLPTMDEQERWIKFLQGTHSNADTIRKNLMTTGEFQNQNGYVNVMDLQDFRTSLWMKLILRESDNMIENPGTWPSAKELYLKILLDLQQKNNQPE